MKKTLNVNDIFEDIDKQLIDQGVPITLRHMKASSKVSEYFDNVPIPLSPTSLLPNNELGNQLCIWLDGWYSAMYGESQRFNSDLGFFYKKLKGDLWRYRVPDFYGTCNFFVDRNLTTRGENNETNVLRMSSDMTQAYVNSLDETELEDILTTFLRALNSLEIVSGWRVEKIPFYKAIDADLRTVDAQLERTKLNFGQARWGYSQCAEKILKSWLLKAGVEEKTLKDKYGHNIHKLINAFNKHYEVKLSLNRLNAINCSPSARYEEDIFTDSDVIDAQDWLFTLIDSIGFSPKLATTD